MLTISVKPAIFKVIIIVNLEFRTTGEVWWATNPESWLELGTKQVPYEQN